MDKNKMDIIEKVRAAWKKEFGDNVPADIVSRLEKHNSALEPEIHKLSSARDETSQAINDLKVILKQEELLHSILSEEINVLTKRPDVAVLEQDKNMDPLYASVNKPHKSKQTDSKDRNSTNDGLSNQKKSTSCQLEIGAYEDIKFEVIDKDDDIPEKKRPTSLPKKESRRSVRDKIKMFERSDSESPEDAGDYESISFVKPPPPKQSPAVQRRHQRNEYEEIDIPVFLSKAESKDTPKVVIVSSAGEQITSAQTGNINENVKDNTISDYDRISSVHPTEVPSPRISPVKPPKPLRNSKGKEERDSLKNSETNSPVYSECEPQFSNHVKKQSSFSDKNKIEVDKSLDEDLDDDEGDYCTLQELAEAAGKHKVIVKVDSSGLTENKGDNDIERKESDKKKNVTVLSVKRSDRELSKSTENLSSIKIKSTTISKSVEDLTSTDCYSGITNQADISHQETNDDNMRKYNLNSEQPDSQTTDADYAVVCKGVKNLPCSNNCSDERLNTINVDIAGLLTPAEIEQAMLGADSPVLTKKEKRGGKVPDYEKWDFHKLITATGVSVAENEHFTDTGSGSDDGDEVLYDNVADTEKDKVRMIQSDDSGWSETTSPEEKQKIDSPPMKHTFYPHKESVMSSNTEGSRISSASCATVDGSDVVFLPRCDSIDGALNVESGSDERCRSFEEDNESVLSADGMLDKMEFEETLTEESVARYKTEQLRMRHLVVKGILESEKSYLHVIDQLCKAKHFLQSAGMKNCQIALEDVTTIFYKLDDIHKVHKEFITDLEGKLKTWTDDQSIASAFKTLVFYFKIYEDYVNNYPIAVDTIRKYQENDDTRQLLESRKKGPRNYVKEKIREEFGEQMEAFKDDALRLEEILLKPVQRIQTNNLVIHDLIKHTPESHPDYVPLQKALKLSEENLKTYNKEQANFNKNNAPESRHLVKSGFLVEVSRDKKQTRQLRYVFLFNDVIICTKHKGGSRHKEVSFKFLWSMPISVLSIHVKGESKYTLKESLDELKYKIGNLKCELRDEMVKADSVKDKASYLTQKRAARNVEKLKKKVQEQEATLVEALPRLPLNLDADTFKSRTFLFPTDYERSEWREALETQTSRFKGQPPVQLSSHDCEALIDNTKLHMQVNGIGTVLLKKDEEMLNGSLNVTIHKLQGLDVVCEVYCCIEMDSYGHFYKKAQTRACRYMNDASWDEDFELELDGSQTLRILCYKKQPVEEDDLIVGKCALELSLSWLNSKFNEKTISMNDVSITISIRHTPSSRTLKRTQSKLRSGVFGVRIENITKRESKTVPSIVTTCVQQVEARGLHEVGIYRVSGVTSEVQNLKKIFDKNPIIAGSHTESADIHAVTGVLKLFFRELPEPLFTEPNYKSFVQTIQLQNEEAKEKCMLELLHSLHDANYYTIVYMIEHLVRVASLSGENKMSVANLATIFGPTLLHPAVKDSNMDPTLQMVQAARDASVQSEILHFLIKLAASGKSIRKSATLSSSTKKDSDTSIIASSAL